MKKRLMAIAALCMVFSLTSCGGPQSDDPSTQTVEETATETPPEATEEEPSEEAKEEKPSDETSETDLTGHTLMIYCGAGMTDPFQEISDTFQKETGCEMNVSFANAGQIQSQITTSGEGDLFIAGAAEELQPVETFVESKKDLVRHIPVLAVQTGNPKNITGLASLAEDGVTLIMGDTEATPIGKIAKKALTDAGLFDKITLAASTPTAPQMSTALAAGEADAAIVWKENCKVDGVEIVETSDLDAYIKTIPAATLNCAADLDAAAAFNEYLATEKATAIWEKYGYEIVE
ncbi:MAG: molybdate ABC transporter substrate-binding protein [Eubacteriales bacterium]|nr:molybdate ABC transporter substrate-binding protein [Eubacteriales bacterium]